MTDQADRAHYKGGRRTAPGQTGHGCPRAIAVALTAALVIAATWWGVSHTPSQGGPAQPAAQETQADAGAPAATEEAPEGETSSVPVVPEEPPVEARDLRDAIQMGGTPDSLPSSQGYAKLTRAIGTLEDQGHGVGVYLCDLSSGATVTYRKDVRFYPASSFKGPFAVALYEMLVDTGQVSSDDVDDLVSSMIVNSDNNAYTTLRKRYGMQMFGSWLKSFGFDPSDYGGQHTYRVYNYPYTTPDEFARMWAHMYAYLSSESPSASYLSSLFEQRSVSAISNAVGDSYRSWGKAGWYPHAERDGATAATVDAGIVFSDTGTYLVVAMCDAPEDFDALTQVCSALDATHDAMVA